MEKTMSQAERIKRAEEVYYRRNYERANYRNNQFAPYKNKEIKMDSKNVKIKIARKMIIQIAICAIIYFSAYAVQNSNQFFSKDVIDKTKEVLQYDMSFDNLYAMANAYFNDVKNKINGAAPNNQNENTQNSESQNAENNIEDTANSNTQNQEITNESQVDLNTENQNNIEEGVGGADETQLVAEEKSQEELDIEYIKQNSSFIWPLNGVITSPYGTRTPTEIVTANHYGIDIAGNIGDTIVAAIDGTVTLASSEGDYGNHLKIENGEIETLYAHCSKLCLEVGATVKQGDKIAEVGQTRKSNTDHTCTLKLEEKKEL